MNDGDHRDIAIMRREIESIPDVLATQIDSLLPAMADLAHELRPSDDGTAPDVVLAGCGDSYFAGIATRFAFAELASTPAQAIEALEFARYGARLHHASAESGLLVAMSYSGEVGRTIEAAMAARARGWRTLAVTGRRQGRLASVTEHAIVLDVPSLGTSPGTSTYVSMLVALYLLAAELAGARGRPDDRDRLVRAVRSVPELADRTLALTAESAEGFAEVLRESTLPTFLGAGPSFATARFGAAKVLESVQRPALAEELEEWAHQQYFASDRGTPTIVVAPGGPSRSRADELLAEMRFIEVPTILVTDITEDIAPGQLVLPFAAGAPEAISPLLSCLPIAYGVALLAMRLGTRSYGFRSEAHEREHYETIHRVGTSGSRVAPPESP